MGLLSFFKSKDVSSKTIQFSLKSRNKEILENCKKYGYVSLWTKAHLSDITIYAPASVGGDGELGYVPDRYRKKIRNHILSAKYYGMSGPPTNNYDALVTDVTGNRITISIVLLSTKEHENRIHDLIEKNKQALKNDLEKKYSMKRPVEIRFNILDSLIKKDIEHLELKIFDKEYYLSNPFELVLQLVRNGEVIAETQSQRDKVKRVVKAKFNGQELDITFKDLTKHDIIAIVDPIAN